MSTRRDFLKLLPLSAAGVWSGGIGLSSLLASPSSRAEAAQVRGSATRPFIMVTLGDSIMWGQGLPESMKFRNIVAAWIQAHLGGRPVQHFPLAHSGAHIIVNSGETDYAPSLSGEIPRDYPSVVLQAGMAQSALAAAPFNFAAADVDLVLVDGGINDVGVPTILNPRYSSGDIGAWAHTVCASRMDLLLNGGCASYPCSQLFPGVLKMFPKAAVIIVGYYQIASKLTDPGELTAYVSSIGALTGVTGAIISGALTLASIDQIINNSVTWKNETDVGFGQLVGAANRQSGPPYRVGFASPAFGDDNCFAAPHSYLFNVSPFNGFAGDESAGLAGISEPAQQSIDDVQWSRARACAAAGRTTVTCPDACMGHPNPVGAQAYVDAVLRSIFTLAPYLATRGLVENLACGPLRAQENVPMNEIRRAQADIAQMGKEQQQCQAGSGPDGRGVPSAKPIQCGAREIEAEKKKLNASMVQPRAQLAVIEKEKLQAGCWY